MITKQSSTEILYYTETDHLGSIIGLVTPEGSYAEQFSYDAWGRRRNPVNWTYDSIPAATLIDRGFTGHEHLDKFDLINMNGRMYDPVIGRFLSVDPFIQFAGNAQNFNGYGYCMNNPLKYSDPSGMLLEPRINPVDEGHPYNPEAAAWLANYYSQSFGGGGGAGKSWLNSYLNASHLGFDVTAANFNYAYNRPDINGTITFKTGITDYFAGYSLDHGKSWIVTDRYLYSEWNYATMRIHAGQGGWLGDGLDLTGRVNLVANGFYSSLAKNSGNSTLGSNGNTYFAKSSQRGFYGNQYVTTKSLAGIGRASKFLVPVGHAISLGQVGYGVYQDGGTYGYNAQVATGSAIGGLAGGFAVAKAGAAMGGAIGAFFGGVGAVPGALIGGFIGGVIGGFYGSKAGEAAVNYYY